MALFSSPQTCSKGPRKKKLYCMPPTTIDIRQIPDLDVATFLVVVKAMILAEGEKKRTGNKRAKAQLHARVWLDELDRAYPRILESCGVKASPQQRERFYNYENEWRSRPLRKVGRPPGLGLFPALTSITLSVDDIVNNVGRSAQLVDPLGPCQPSEVYSLVDNARQGRSAARLSITMGHLDHSTESQALVASGRPNRPHIRPRSSQPTFTSSEADEEESKSDPLPCFVRSRM